MVLNLFPVHTSFPGTHFFAKQSKVRYLVVFKKMLNLVIPIPKVLKQGKLIAVSYTLRTH